MAKNAKTTDLSVKGQFTQADIPTLLDRVNAEIKFLKGDKEKSSRITGGCGPFGIISEVNDVETLIKAYSYIKNKAVAYDAVKAEFKAIDPSADIPTFKESGATVEAWIEEIQTQFRTVTFDAKLKKLTAVKDELEKNLSQEAKLAASLANIADILGA